MKMIWNANFRSINKSVVGTQLCRIVLGYFRRTAVAELGCNQETHGLEGLKYSGKSELVPGFWSFWELAFDIEGSGMQEGSVGASEGEAG